MKKFLCTTIPFLVGILLLLTACAPKSAHGLKAAEPTVYAAPAVAQASTPQSPSTSTPSAGDYACILREDTFFYDSPNETRGLFLLPPTYYVKLLDLGAEYSRVEYLYDDSQTKKVVGYVKTEHLTFVDYLPKRPYLYYVFELSYKIESGVLHTSDVLNELLISCAYYGDYRIGSQTYCYVLRGDSFGYVPKPADLTIPENTEYAEYVASQNADSSKEESLPKEETASPAQIAILIALCLLVPVLAALILKPPRRPPYETDPD